MDFLTKDKDGIDTVIEVKMKADDHTVTQLRRYMRSHKNDSGKSKVRGIIVAEEFSKTALDDVKEHCDLGIDIQACRCKKQFGFERLL
jgi:RecB family endonuclease NucS